MSASTDTRTDRTPRVVLVLAFLALTLEGYDIIMYGTVVPSLLTDSGWGVTPDDAGHIGSLAVLGMAIGALGAALLTERVGRRRVLIPSVVLFSVGMALAAVAGSAAQLGLFRFLVGIGAGALLPTAVAMVIEFSPDHRRGINVAIAFTGTGVGGCAAGLLGTWLVPGHGFRPMFAIGAIPALVVVPVLWRRLPDSLAWLLARGRGDDARRTAARLGVGLPTTVEGDARAGSASGALRAVLSPRHLPATALFCTAVFFCLLVLFGANAWLPALMIRAGYGVTSSLAFLLVLNVGAIVGTLVAAPIGDRVGFKVVTAASFLAAAVGLTLLAAKPATAVVVLLVAVVGLGTSGTQILVNAYVGSHFPAELRATALGLALGVGRVGGILGPTYGASVIVHQSPSWQFYAFAVPAAIGAVVISLVPRAPRVEAPVVQFVDSGEPSTAR